MSQNELTGYPSVDKPWLKYYSEDVIRMKTPECSDYENIYQQNKICLNDIALLYFGKKITYRRLFDEIGKTASALLSYSIVKNGLKRNC